jgi:uncharacterized iron-regulated membrane protein
MSQGTPRRRAWRFPAHSILRWWDIHSWAGILGGLILYIMFVAGATVLFHHEVEVWEEPIHQRAAPQTAGLFDPARRRRSAQRAEAGRGGERAD